MRLFDALRRLAAISMLILLAGCGAGGPLAQNGGVGSGGTGISWGSVTGFGSLVVDGATYSSASGAYLAGTETAESSPDTAQSVDLGNQLQISLDGEGKPHTVRIDAALIGPATTLDLVLGRFVVNGVSVHTNTDLAAGPVTYYSGLDGFGPGLDGAMLEVHGVHAVDGANGDYIQATLVRQISSSTLARRITGRIEGLDTGAREFRIGSTVIGYDVAASILPAGAALGEGALVNVWSAAPASGGRLDASVIRVRTLHGLTGQARISGIVSALAGNRFTLAGVPVDASHQGLAATLSGLANGDYVVAAGTIGGSTLVATELTTARSRPQAVELRGTVSAFVSNARFLVRGVTVDASLARFPNGPIPGGANDNTYVVVSGQVVANKVRADSVSVLSRIPEGRTVEQSGTVSGLTGGTFVLSLRDGNTRAVTLAANASFEGGASSRLVDGANVAIEATSTSTGLVAYSVEFRKLDAGSNHELETRGRAYDVSATRFSVNGLVIEINGRNASGLADGVEVEVHFIESGGVYLATEIGVEDD